jgi:thiamine biosynthesis protein ThiS
MRVTLNGTTRDVDAATVADLVAELRLQGPFAVELNREVVPKAAFADRTLHDGDRIEVVQFVGGG